MKGSGTFLASIALMYPRWHPDDPGNSKPHQPQGNLGVSRADYFSEPLLDLEQQLAAELNGASWAVVSFVPEDKEWCQWIYRCLNGYPLPPSLVDRVTPHGFPRPDCLSIFPDLQDPSYSERTALALANSAYLIVVCSAHSAQSAIVDEQIRVFKAAGGDERILALVVDGLPDPELGSHRCALGCGWLPVWLRWRYDEKGFCPADRSEPRIVDARRGRASLRQVRDALLTAVLDMDAGELARLDGFNRPLPEWQNVPKVPPTSMPHQLSPDFSLPPRRRGAERDGVFMVSIAVVLTIVAVTVGVKSFRELSAEEPPSALTLGPRLTPLAARTPVVAPEVATVLELEPEEKVEPPVAVAKLPETFADAPTAGIVLPPPPAPVEAPAPTVAQYVPESSSATTRVQRKGPGTYEQVVAAYIPASVENRVPEAPASDAVLQDEVSTLERRGDEIMAEKRVEDALDLYSTALDSAQEYAARKGAGSQAKDQVVMLMRKLAMLQVQNASTAEARTTYQQARQTLLKLRSQGAWTRERAKTLDEMESRLLSLPRD